MKTLLLSATLGVLFLHMNGYAAGSIMAPGTYGAKKLVTKLEHDLLESSSNWKMGDGEPPISPVNTSDLAFASLKIQFPVFNDAVVREVSLVSTKHGCYYRVLIVRDVDMAEVAKAGGHMKPDQLNYYVLLNSTVINPVERADKESKSSE
jgi:hypothetical protein